MRRGSCPDAATLALSSYSTIVLLQRSFNRVAVATLGDAISANTKQTSRCGWFRPGPQRRYNSRWGIGGTKVDAFGGFLALAWVVSFGYCQVSVYIWLPWFKGFHRLFGSIWFLFLPPMHFLVWSLSGPGSVLGLVYILFNHFTFDVMTFSRAC